MRFERNIKIKELMTEEVVTVGLNDSLLVVEEIFKSNEFHHIPVIDKNKVVKGILSRADLYKMQDSLTIFNTNESKRHNQSKFRSMLAEEIMVKQVAKLKPTDTALVAVGIFRENLFHSLPIVDDEGKLVGILTTYDLLTYAYNEPAYLD